MRFRKIALALVACLALGAFATSAAQAAEGEGWTIGTTENQTTAGTKLAEKVRVKCKRHGTTPLVFTSTLLGSEVELTAEGVDCLEKAGSTNAATIDNCASCKDENGVTKAIPGHSEGVLTFTGVKVVKPQNCSVAGGELTTSQLTDRVIMDPTSSTGPVFDKFYPEEAAKGFITIEFAGTLCPLAEDTGTVKGTACGEAVHTNAGGTAFEPNKTGTLTKVQTLFFNNEAQQKTGGCKLTFNEAAANLSGAVDNELESLKPFGAD